MSIAEAYGQWVRPVITQDDQKFLTAVPEFIISNQKAGDHEVLGAFYNRLMG